MQGINSVTILGSLGVTPELRFTQAGTPVLSLRIATNERYQDKSKEWKDRTEWHSATVWGARAEGLAKFLAKGMPVCVEGSLRTSKYEKDGVDHYRTEIIAKNVVVPGGKASDAGDEERGNNGGGDDGGSQPRRQQAQRAPSGGGGGGGQRQTATKGGGGGGGETAGDYVVTFGRDKDKKISEVTDLSYLRGRLVDELADDSKSKWHDKSRKQLASIDAELARRGGGGGGRPAGGQQRAQRSAPVSAEYGGGGGDDDFDDGGYGEGGEEIPF